MYHEVGIIYVLVESNEVLATGSVKALKELAEEIWGNLTWEAIENYQGMGLVRDTAHFGKFDGQDEDDGSISIYPSLLVRQVRSKQAIEHLIAYVEDSNG